MQRFFARSALALAQPRASANASLGACSLVQGFRSLNMSRSSRPMEHSPDSLFVGNLAFDVSKEELIERFAEVAPVQSVKVITDHNTGLSRGFAFVTLENAEDNEKALRELDGQELCGRNIRVNFRQTPPKIDRSSDPSRLNPHSLYLTNIAEDVTFKQLYERFSPCGNLTSLSIGYDPETQSRKGFAVITFEASDVVKQILQEDQTDLAYENETVMLVKGDESSRVQARMAFKRKPDFVQRSQSFQNNDQSYRRPRFTD